MSFWQPIDQAFDLASVFFVFQQNAESRASQVFANGGRVREDGRLVHNMYLVEVKNPDEVKYPWDYYRVLRTIPGVTRTHTTIVLSSIKEETFVEAAPAAEESDR